MSAPNTVSVRISAKRYKAIAKDAAAKGHTISWYLSYIIDSYYLAVKGQVLPEEKRKP